MAFAVRIVALLQRERVGQPAADGRTMFLTLANRGILRLLNLDDELHRRHDQHQPNQDRQHPPHTGGLQVTVIELAEQRIGIGVGSRVRMRVGHC